MQDRRNMHETVGILSFWVLQNLTLQYISKGCFTIYCSVSLYIPLDARQCLMNNGRRAIVSFQSIGHNRSCVWKWRPKLMKKTLVLLFYDLLH